MHRTVPNKITFLSALMVCGLSFIVPSLAMAQDIANIGDKWCGHEYQGASLSDVTCTKFGWSGSFGGGFQCAPGTQQPTGTQPECKASQAALIEEFGKKAFCAEFGEDYGKGAIEVCSTTSSTAALPPEPIDTPSISNEILYKVYVQCKDTCRSEWKAPEDTDSMLHSDNRQVCVRACHYFYGGMSGSVKITN